MDVLSIDKMNDVVMPLNDLQRIRTNRFLGRGHSRPT